MKIIVTLLAAVLLQMIPINSHFRWFEPNFIALVMIFWLVYAPGSLNVYQIFIFGIICDVLFGTMLGEHSFSLLITAYLVYRMLRPLRTWPIWQQFILIFMILFFNHISATMIKMTQGYEITGAYMLFLTPFMGLVAWPVIRNLFFGFVPRVVR